jgi:putative ABC transport system ATP-binding protein
MPQAPPRSEALPRRHQLEACVSGDGLIIRLEGVTKVYRRGTVDVPVLQRLDLDVPRGEFLALMGPSGSGKSTILNLVSGIDTPTDGRVIVAGIDLGDLDASALAGFRSRHIGFIFQSYNLIPVLTAYQNVELPLLLTDLTRKERREHVLAAMAVVALTDRLDHYPRQLSGGQEQRVAIARAIVTDPTLFVADEPTGDLDAQSATDVLHLLQRLHTDFGKSIVMVTHDPHAAARADRTLHLEKGVLVESVERNRP